MEERPRQLQHGPDVGLHAPADAAEQWLEARLEPPPPDWSSVLPAGISSRQILGFNPQTGQPATWPLRYSMVSWAATLKGLAPGKYALRARAVENQCYVIAPAQGGRHPNGRRTWGHSMVVDPWGEVIAQASQGEAVVYASLQRERQEEQNRTLRKKSTSRLNHDYKSKATLELADQVTECEEVLEKLTLDEKQQRQTLL